MTAFAFKKATREKAKGRIALVGPSGSGKTYTALAVACGMGGRVAVIDTERGSASKYVGAFQFDVLELESFSPETYVQAIQAARAYEVLVIDSLSHAWSGKDGALEQVDRAAKRSQSNNTFAAWRDVTPMHNRLVDAMLSFPGHVIVTLRAKTEYVLEVGKNGKQAPRKVGMAPIQRDGIEYEFDIVGDITLEHEMLVSKTRCADFDGAVISKPGAEFAGALMSWLNTGSTPGGSVLPLRQRSDAPVRLPEAPAEVPPAAASKADAAVNPPSDDKGPKFTAKYPVKDLAGTYMRKAADDDLVEYIDYYKQRAAQLEKLLHEERTVGDGEDIGTRKHYNAIVKTLGDATSVLLFIQETQAEAANATSAEGEGE